LAQYEAMKSSFIEAGFDESKCRYSLFDNSQRNIYEPYNTFNTIKANTIEPYIIFCHQDVLLNQGHGFDQLVKVLDELDKLDSKWAIVGNAGINNNYQAVVKITDGNCTPNWTGNFPQKVHSLDENFLVIKSSATILCSQELKGFHFYGIDLCLNSIKKGYSCYVINFHLTHLSGGNLNETFWELQAKFYKTWSNEFNLCYVKTMTGVIMFFSKYRMLRYLFKRNKLAQFCLSNSRLHRLINVYYQ
jgi:hypothetical protein